MKANEFFKKVGVDAVRSYLAAYEDDLTNDLKRLVEVHDLVESFGGVEMAKRYLDENLECEDSKTLRQAIADVESCQ